MATPQQTEAKRGTPSQKARSLNPKCGARLKRDGKYTGKTCSQMAGYGTDHPGYGQCRWHGGLTPAGKKAAARIAGRQIIEKEKRFGGHRVDNITAEEVLLEEVRRAAGLVRWLEDRISQWEWDPESGDLGGLPDLIVVHEGFKTYAVYDSEQRAWLQVYREERQHLAKAAKMCIDAGLSERMVRIQEDQGRILATAIRLILEALDLTPRQAKQVPEVVPMILRRVATGEISA